MKLLTAEIKKKLPPLRSTDGKGKDAPVIVKFFNPSGSQTWLAVEGEFVPEADTWEFFGWVNLFGDWECGYFHLNELESIRGRFGLGIERDMYLNPCTVAQAIGEPNA